MNSLRRSHRRLVKEILVPDAVTYWEDVLTVVNRGDTIRVNRKCANNQYFLADGEATQYCKNKCVETLCGEYKVPDDHLEVSGFLTIPPSNETLQGCSTCDSSGRNCKNETRSGNGVEGADFVLYITAITTDQVPGTPNSSP